MTATVVRVAVIVNPTARNGTSQTFADRAVARLLARGAEASVTVGDSAEDTIAALRRSRDLGVDVVVVIGGDGTARLAVQELRGTDIPLAIVPVGTGNDLATALGIPSDPIAAVDLVFDGAERAIDVGRVTRSDGSTEIFATVFASGFDSKVNERANRMRWPQGRARYNIAIGAEFALLKSIPYRLSWVTGTGTTEVYDGRLLLTAVGNTSSYGGGIPICPSADPSDGILELTIIKPASRLRLIHVLAMAFRGRHIAHPAVETHRARSVTVEAHGMTGYADGDPMGPLPATIDLMPRSLRMLLPN